MIDRPWNGARDVGSGIYRATEDRFGIGQRPKGFSEGALVMPYALAGDGFFSFMRVTRDGNVYTGHPDKPMLGAYGFPAEQLMRRLTVKEYHLLSAGLTIPVEP